MSNYAGTTCTSSVAHFDDRHRRRWPVEVFLLLVISLMVGSLTLTSSTPAASAADNTISTVSVRPSPIGRSLTSLVGGIYLGHDGAGGLYMDLGTAYGIVKSPSLTGNVAVVTTFPTAYGFHSVGLDGLLYGYQGSSVIRRNSDDSATTVAGNGTAGSSGDGGPAIDAQIAGWPSAFGADGRFVINEQSRIRGVDSSGIISTRAGSGAAGDLGDGGAATAARISAAQVGVDGSNRIVFSQYRQVLTTYPPPVVNFVVPSAPGKIRRVESDGTITTRYAAPDDLAVGPISVAGDDAIYFTLYQRATGASIAEIRRIAPDGTISVVAGTGIAGHSPDGTPATATNLPSYLSRLDALADGSVLFDEWGSIRRFVPGGNLQTVTGAGSLPVARTGTSLAVAGAGRLIVAPFMEAVGGAGVTLDPRGTAFDPSNGQLRTQARMPSGEVELYSSTGTGTSLVLERRVISPAGVETVSTPTIFPESSAYGPDGTLYYFDGLSRGNDCRIRARTPAGVTTVFAGGDCASGSPDPYGSIAVAPDGAVYFHVGQSIFRSSSAGGTPTRFAGKDASACVPTDYEDGRAPLDSCLGGQGGMLFDSSGSLLFVSDSRVRKIVPGGVVSTVAGKLWTEGSCYSCNDGDGGSATAAHLFNPGDIALDSQGNLYIATIDAVRKVAGVGSVWSVPGVPRSVSGVAGGGGVLVSWLAPLSDGGQPLLDYTVVASPGGASVTVPRGSTSVVVPGLSGGVAYTFAVTARNSMGVSAAGSGSLGTAPVALVPLGVPGRLLDTRKPSGSTVDGLHQATGRVGAGQVYELPVAGRGGVPADAASAVLNVTAVDPSGGGFVTVFPCGQPLPQASNLNYQAGDVVPNAVLAKIGAGGKVCFFTFAEADLLVDVAGYFPTSTSLVPLTAPARVMDSRKPSGSTVDGLHQAVGRIAAGATYELPIAGRAGVPLSAATVVLNVTAVNPGGGGFVTVFPCGQQVPQASNLNYQAGDVVPNAVLAKVGTGGKVCFYSYAETDLLVDVGGYFGTDVSLVPLSAPGRLFDSRKPNGSTVDGLHKATGRVGAGQTYELPVAGRGGVPANATSVVLNVTAVSPGGGGFVTVFPCGQQVPQASNLNYQTGDVVPNAVLAKVGAGGKVCLYTYAETDLIVDVAAYFNG
jgi:Fibronectin type III domain